MTETKVCSRCKEAKELSYFAVDKVARQGVKSRCKLCVNEVNRARRLRLKPVQEEKRKRCKLCNENKLHSEFHNRRDSPDGKGTTCKACVLAKKKKQQIASKPSQLLHNGEPVTSSNPPPILTEFPPYNSHTMLMDKLRMKHWDRLLQSSEKHWKHYKSDLPDREFERLAAMHHTAELFNKVLFGVNPLSRTDSAIGGKLYSLKFTGKSRKLHPRNIEVRLQEVQ